MFHELVHKSLNQQINVELQAWYEYLGMASWCSRQQLHGCGPWLRVQSQEEYTHAMKLYQFQIDRNLKGEPVGVESSASGFRKHRADL